MKVQLFDFQNSALEKLRYAAASSLGQYQDTRTPQIVSYTAPTGAGKTIIIAALIESIYNGYSGNEIYPSQDNAIFIWLSDSPQLNEQSRLKIETKADKCYNRCVSIDDNSFDKEVLDDGYIYFINTQKLSRASNLTKHSDTRQFTIWETFANTVEEKSDRLYFIIDEAHRGAREAHDLARATTIMQKFLKGSPEDNLPPMPVLIGMTATSERFNRLASNIGSTTIHQIITSVDEVRASGLLKDRIVITYPDSSGNEMAVLEAAAEDWCNVWKHWAQYCSAQHCPHINPILLVQVQDAHGHVASDTDLSRCLQIIEDRFGMKFAEGQVAHAFGSGVTSLEINGLNVPYVEPSAINDDKNIMVVFFKEALSTGWDCPRAETMMSFRSANDATYIAQLLGRMVRTPMHQRITVDETLNDVHLFLPKFKKETVANVLEALRNEEGATIPAEVEAYEAGQHGYDILYAKFRRGTVPAHPDLHDGDMARYAQGNASTTSLAPFNSQRTDSSNTNLLSYNDDDNDSNLSLSSEPEGDINEKTPSCSNYNEHAVSDDMLAHNSDIDREGIVKFINTAGLLTYKVRNVLITDYMKSAYALARLLTYSGLNSDASLDMRISIAHKIRNYRDSLINDGTYSSLVEEARQFKLCTHTCDVFGKKLNDVIERDLFTATDSDIDRQFRLAELRLGNEGVAYEYLKLFLSDDEALNKIDVIIYAAEPRCLDDLQRYAKDQFHLMVDNYRRQLAKLSIDYKNQYDKIVSNGDSISEHNFTLPEEIRVRHEEAGQIYYNHLFVGEENGYAKYNLNEWEKIVIEEEQQQNDFVCWLRNPSSPRSWGLCIPYKKDETVRAMYPDFLIVRKDKQGYVVDILEPHDPGRDDNFGKAKGLAEYAKQNPGVGRIQLIRVKRAGFNKKQAYRLDMSRMEVCESVLKCSTQDELNHIFERYSFLI